MSNKTNKLIPELRFPEFVDEREWDEKFLGKIADNVTTGKLDANAMSEKGKYRFYTCAKNYYQINEYAFDTEALLIAGNGAHLGYIHHFRGKFNAYQRTYVLSDFSENVIYLKYFLERFLPSRITSEKKEGNTPYIVLGTVTDMLVYLPENPNEQEKIASCLSSLDEVIAAHSQKLETLKAHKKGLMQNLFPQEGETVPKYRFSEFLEDGEWVVTTVEKLIQEKVLFPPKDGNHGSIHPKSSDYVKKGIPFIMASDLKNGQIDFSNCAYLKKEQADSLQKGFAMSGDVLLTHKGTVGEVALLGELEYPYIMLTPQVTYYRIKDKSKLVNEFLSAFFNSDFFQRNLVKVSGGGTRAYVGITKQKEFNVHYPKNPEEQKRIASCLSALDDVITAQGEKIEQLKLHKKGLMQGLFPKVND